MSRFTLPGRGWLFNSFAICHLVSDPINTIASKLTKLKLCRRQSLVIAIRRWLSEQGAPSRIATDSDSDTWIRASGLVLTTYDSYEPFPDSSAENAL